MAAMDASASALPFESMEEFVAQSRLSGVIAAAATPVDEKLEPDLGRFVELSTWLLDNGCDALNICGTTGEGTSLSAAQRTAVMEAAAKSLPTERLMIGTGAAAVDDAATLTERAAEFGLSGALLLPPFYYKDVSEDGVLRYFDKVIQATKDKPINLYLYNFPALSGVQYTPQMVRKLREAFGSRIAGLKDSSGNLEYAAEVNKIADDFDVFPSNEGILDRARAGEFAGCISASANVNAIYCGQAYRDGNSEALETAKSIRALVSRKALIASVKTVLASVFNDKTYERLLPPLTELAPEEKTALVNEYGSLSRH